MIALTFQVHLIEPVLVTQVGGGDPNSAISFDFIPGSVIRGALINKYLQRKKDSTADDFFDHFFDGTVRFLNAYPLSQKDKRSLPTPLSWRVKKDEENKTIMNIAFEQGAIAQEDSGKTWKVVSEPFCHMSEDGRNKVELYEPKIQIQVHTARDNRQRLTEGESTIFRYESLDAGQKFSAVVLAERTYLEKYIKPLLPDGAIFNLGKSHLAGYGKVKIEKVEIQENWDEYKSAGDTPKNNIVVTLLSDIIVRDIDTGAHVTSLKPIVDTNPEKAFLRTLVIGGFNRTWNLPLPQTPAIKAGSVFVFNENAELHKRLKVLEATGIGERREDGFGRISVDWNTMDKIIVMEQEQIPPEQVLLHGGSAVLAQQMVNRMMHAKLDQALIKKINDLTIEGKDQLRNSQLSCMHAVSYRALSNKNAGEILEHLSKMRKTAREQFEYAKIGDKSLEKWLKLRGENIQSIWNELDVNSIEQPCIGGIKPDFKDLALEYTVRLIDGVLHKASKEAKT